MAVQTFRKSPTYRGAQQYEQVESAFDMPLSIGQTFGQQLEGGVIESFGLGTALRDFAIPQSQTRRPSLLAGVPILGSIEQGYQAARDLFNPAAQEPPLTEQQWKESPFFRDSVPFDPGMTTERAAALAIWNDAKAVRDFYGSKRPITSFFGNLAGQSLDPINYVPVAGPAVKAAAVAKLGHIGGSIAVGALDAAANTAAAGIATTGARAEYGDDVSWQRQVSDIATAALIGAAFGGVGGALTQRQVSRATAEAAESIVPLAEVQEARIALGGGVRDLVLSDTLALLPNEIEPVQRKAVDLQQPLPLDSSPRPRSVVTPTGVRVTVVPEIVDATTLTAATGDLQPRDRSRAASDAQIEDIAINLDPERLLFSPDADRGAPVVGPDGVVESGNGRRAAIVRAAEAYPEKFEAYKQALRDQGFDVPDEGVPMLISRRVSELTPEDRVAFVTGANTSAIARMSATEAAMGDTRAMGDDVIAAYAGGDVKAAANRDFVRAFLGNLPQNERASLVDADGSLNTDGVRRVENSLVAAAYGDPDLVARMAESTDDNAKSITGAMSDVSGDWTRMRRSIEAGDIDAELDLTPHVLAALRLISRAREQAALQGRPVSQLVDEAVRQIDMIDGALDARTEAIVRIFYGEGYRRAKSRDDIGVALRSIVSEVENAGRPQLFAEAAVSAIDIANAVAGRVDGDLFNVRAGDDVGREGAAQGRAPDRQPAVSDASAADQGQPVAEVGRPLALASLPIEQVPVAQQRFKLDAPARTIDEIYARADAAQQELADIGALLAESEGVEFRNPGVKSKATTIEKMGRKGYSDTRELTDIVRGGFVVQTPDQADVIVETLSSTLSVLDEGWAVTPAGYFDRKILVKFDDGTIGEVQIWHPDLLEAKDTRGHKLYERMRQLDKDAPEYAELLDQQRRLYFGVADSFSPEWLGVMEEFVTGNGGRSGQVDANAASSMMRPESATSSGRASDQSVAPVSTAQADLPDMTAGRPSQLTNVVSMPGNMRAGRGPVNAAPAAPEPIPVGRAQAGGRVGKPDDLKAVAEQYGVDAKTGDFIEQQDVAALVDAGNIMPEEADMLAAAEVDFQRANAYADAVTTAARCFV